LFAFNDIYVGHTGFNWSTFKEIIDMAAQSTALESLPEPGVAVFPQNLSTNMTNLVMQRKPDSTSWEVKFTDGRPFLRVKSPTFTTSNRKHIVDASANIKLCDLRSKRFSRTESYYAEAADNQSPLLEISNKKLKAGFLSDGGRYETTMKFTNVAAGTPDELYLQGDSFEALVNAVTCKGVRCGLIDEKCRYTKGQYRLSVAPGLDPFLVVVLAVALDDKEAEDENARTARIANVAANSRGPIV
jgi:hypothetical protein